MDHKIVVIGGSVAAVALVAFIAIKHKATQTAAANSQQSDMPNTSYFSGTIPSSGGISSGADSGGSATPTDPANSGSSATGGGFDLGSLFGSLFKSQADTSSLQIRSGANVAESAILSGIDLGPYGGSVQVNHSATGTSLSVQKGDTVGNLVSAAYQSVFGRAPDSAGASYFNNALQNGGLTISGLTQDLMNSNEYMAAHPSAQPVYSAPSPQPQPQVNPVNTSQQISFAPATQVQTSTAPTVQNSQSQQSVYVAPKYIANYKLAPTMEP